MLEQCIRLLRLLVPINLDTVDIEVFIGAWTLPLINWNRSFVVCNRIWPFYLLVLYQSFLLALVVVLIGLGSVLLQFIRNQSTISIEAILLLFDLVQTILSWGRRNSLASTCARPMLSTNLGCIEVSKHHIVVISEFAWCVHSFLDIIAWELFYLPFDSVLHEVFLLRLHLIAASHAR